MAKRINAAMATRLFTALMVIVVIGIGFGSCTEEKTERDSSLVKLGPTPDPVTTASYNFERVNCVVNGNKFDHTFNSTVEFFKNGEFQTVEERKLSSKAVLSIEPAEVRVSDKDGEPSITNISQPETSFESNKLKQTYWIAISNGALLKLAFEADHDEIYYNGYYYDCGHDSITNIRFIGSEKVELFTRAAVSDQYLKDKYDRNYFVEVTTIGYAGDGVTRGKADVDTLVVSNTELVFADNDVTKTIQKHGTEPISETQQKDSVVIVNTWKDGHTENQVFRNIRNRWLKSIDRREVIVNAFSGQIAGQQFTKADGEEEDVRKSENWLTKARKSTLTKPTEVDGHAEEIQYTLYQESAVFTLGDLTVTFDYNEWQIENYADDFKSEPISTMSGYDQLSYKNEIKTYYLGYVQVADEEIDWFKKAVEFDHYDVVNAKRTDYTTYTLVSLDKIAIYSDSTRRKVGSYSAKLPISAIPLSHWVINTDVFGSYVSDELKQTLSSKSQKTAEKFFSYTEFVYLLTNTVSGQTNKGELRVPNKIVFDDGDVRHEFEDSELTTGKVDESTAEAGETDELTTYKYTCVAGVTFGETAQEVTLPGTINVTKDNGPHIHGKVKAVYFTTTPNENRSFYKSVCVLQFEDGFRSVGLSENGANEFNFNMSSWKNVNSAVYTGGSWIPAIAEDNTGARCMIWKDENGTPKRTLDFITATRDAWNNGHNTVSDSRRSASISKSGYSVTLYLNGNAGQTLKF